MAFGRVPATGQGVSVSGPLRGAASSAVRYVNKVGSDGWLQARPAEPGGLVPLHKYTKVALLESRGGRTYFKVLEGAAKGRKLSLSDANAIEYLGTRPPLMKAAAAVVTYGQYVENWISAARGGQPLNQQMATLEVEGLRVQVTMNSVWGGDFTPLPAGEYKVMLPDAPHNSNMTRYYRNAAPNLRFDQVWFPIQHGDNSRFVHVGNVSEGCVTVLDLARWADVHEALISHRGSDGLSVASLTVRGKPEKPR